MWIIVENTVILGIKSVLIEDLDHRKFMNYSDRGSLLSLRSNREKEVARIKRLGYSNINYIDYINYISLAKLSPKRKKYIKKEKGSPL